ncbi:MAG: ribonuclease E inhibitor RraB [Gammaproteobacteria bacterium]
MMQWLLLLLVVLAGAAVIYRFYSTMKKGKEVHGRDWDTKLITELRKRGQDPFQPHDVNFFFALPNEPACTAINKQLESEGFQIDVKAVPGNEFPFSLSATRNMRVHAAEMKEFSRRFNELAKAHQGRYDGWGSG